MKPTRPSTDGFWELMWMLAISHVVVYLFPVLR